MKLLELIIDHDRYPGRLNYLALFVAAMALFAMALAVKLLVDYPPLRFVIWVGLDLFWTWVLYELAYTTRRFALFVLAFMILQDIAKLLGG